MAGRHVATTVMGIEVTGLTDFVNALQKITKDTKIGVDAKGLHDEVKKAGKSFDHLLKKASADAFGKDSKKRVAELGIIFRDSMQKTIGLQQRLTQTGLAVEEKTRIKAQLGEESRTRKSLDANLKSEAKANAKWASRRKFIHSEIERSADLGSKNRLQTFARGVSNVYSELGSGKVGGLVGRGFGGASQALKGGGKFVGRDSAKGGMGAAGAGRMIAGLGTMVGVVGGLAAAVGLLIKMFFDMDKQIKDTNKSLIKAGGAYEFMGKTGSASVYDIGQNLEVVRKMAHDVTNNLKWMTMPKEQFKIIEALIEADHGFQKITKGATTAEQQTRKLFDATSMVLQVSKQLGLENTRVAKDMGTFMQDTGMGVNEMRDGFAKLIEVAKTSGFNMKRFYSTILESTSGLYYYNQRLGEAADLLKRLTGMLGQRAGTEFFKSIQKGFAEMGYKERFKQLLTMGGKNRRQVIAAAAEQAADNFGVTLAKNENVKNVLEGLGLKTTSGAGLAGQLAKMSDKQFSTFKARFGIRFGEVGGQEEAGRQLRGLTTLRERQRGVRGGLGAQAKAIGTFQGGTAMAANMANFLGPIHKLSAIQLAAFEEFKGITGSQLETLRQLSSEFTGQFAILKDLKKLAQKKGFDDKENLRLAKRTGYAVEESTKTIKKVSGIEGDKITGFTGGPLSNLNQFIIGQGSAIEDAVGSLIPVENQQLLAAQQVVAHTEPLSKILSITIAGLLSDIREYVKPLESAMLHIVSFLGSDTDGAGAWAKKKIATREVKDKLMERADDRIKEAEDRLQKAKESRGETGPLQKALAFARSQKAGISRMDLSGQMEEAVIKGARSNVDIKEALEDGQLAIENAFTLSHKTAEQLQEDEEKALEDQSEKAKKALDEQTKAASKKTEDLIRSGETNTDEINKEQRQQTLDLIEGFDMANQRHAKAQQLHELGFAGDLYSAAERIINAPQEEQAAIMKRLLAKSQSSADDFIDIEGAMATATNDFILTSGGKLIKPSSQDAIFGMKPGGPIANAMKGGMGGSGANINITIQESHDPQKTYNVVKRALQQAGVM